MVNMESFNTIESGVIGVPQIIIILVIVILFFGGKKIPELMRGLGQGVKEFKDASKGDAPENHSTSEISKEDK
jgi:sec-independent protein translocase protein TatA